MIASMNEFINTFQQKKKQSDSGLLSDNESFNCYFLYRAIVRSSYLGASASEPVDKC